MKLLLTGIAALFLATGTAHAFAALSDAFFPATIGRDLAVSDETENVSNETPPESNGNGADPEASAEARLLTHGRTHSHDRSSRHSHLSNLQIPGADARQNRRLHRICSNECRTARNCKDRPRT
jgi:hypothetical protein